MVTKTKTKPDEQNNLHRIREISPYPLESALFLSPSPTKNQILLFKSSNYDILTPHSRYPKYLIVLVYIQGVGRFR